MFCNRKLKLVSILSPEPPPNGQFKKTNNFLGIVEQTVIFAVTKRSTNDRIESF